jgi:hypothetical protein
MKKNIGTADRVVRTILAIIMIILYFQGIVTGVLGIVLLVLSGILLLTSLVSLCPLYMLLGIKTNKSTQWDN